LEDAAKKAQNSYTLNREAMQDVTGVSSSGIAFSVDPGGFFGRWDDEVDILNHFNEWAE
jgi:hypothetical protein